MDLAKVLQQLHEELNALNAAILSLERLNQGGRRRGRPPEWLAALRKEKPKKKRKSATPADSGDE
jgi:hypothetical protein